MISSACSGFSPTVLMRWWSVVPSTNSMMKYRCPSVVVPKSKTDTIFGWFIRAIVLASRTKRSAKSRSTLTSSGSSFTATERSSASCRAL